MVRSRGQRRASVRNNSQGAEDEYLTRNPQGLSGVADRHQMFRMFDRHAQRPDRWNDDATALYSGEWFEIRESEHDYMFEILPPLWIRGRCSPCASF